MPTTYRGPATRDSGTNEAASAWKAAGTSPVRLIQYVLEQAPELARHYTEVGTLLGDRRVWKLMLGFDEQTPGSKRKNVVCVMNFLEVGHDCLELAILRRLLLRLLTGPESISNFGLLVRCVVHGQIKAELDIILADGEDALEWNGPSSLRPTFNMANVYMLGSRLDGEGYVDISCSDWVQFRHWAIAQRLAVIDGILAERDRFEHGEISMARLKEHIKSAGFCARKDGLLADLILREMFDILDIFRYDFMHTAFQHGFMSNAPWLLCKSVFEVKYGRSNDATPLLRFLRELSTIPTKCRPQELQQHVQIRLVKSRCWWQSNGVRLATARTKQACSSLIRLTAHCHLCTRQ